MRRTFILGTAVLLGWLGWVSATQAQVYIRVPFVRVEVGDGGVGVRAPFVNLYVPPTGRAIYGPNGPPVIVTPPPGSEPLALPQAVKPVMPPAADNGPPQPIRPVQAATLDAFARSFQPKAGNYDVTLMNPLSGRPTAVRFSLPEGTPRRVIVGRDYVEFVYTLRHFVRIEFERDNAIVIAR